MSDATSIAQATGIASAFWLSGIYFSSSHLTLPHLYNLSPAISTDFFKKMYYAGIATAVPLSFISAAGLAAGAYLDPAKRLALGIAAGVTFATMPWTTLVMLGTNNRLVELSEDSAKREKAGPAEVERLLRQWKWMNMLRAAMAGVGGLIALWIILKAPRMII